MYGCPFCDFNLKKEYEECSVTGEPTNGAVMCDFEFENCEIYQDKIQKSKEKEKYNDKA
jgi:hypothetical protein